MTDILNERDERGHHIVPLPMKWWKFYFDTKTPTWQAYGRAVFVQARLKDEALIAARAAASADYPGADIIDGAIGESTADAAAQFAEKKRLIAEWQKNTSRGTPNTRATLEPKPKSPDAHGVTPERIAGIKYSWEQAQLLPHDRDIDGDCWSGCRACAAEHHLQSCADPFIRDLLTALDAQTEELARLRALTTWQPIETHPDYDDDLIGDPVVVWNGAPWLAYHAPDGWHADVDGELLRVVPQPTHFIPAPRGEDSEANHY